MMFDQMMRLHDLRGWRAIALPTLALAYLLSINASSLARESGKLPAVKVGDEKPAETVVPAEPRQTMATFGDWVVRCERPGQDAPGQPAAKRICEAAQALVIKGQQAPVAQIAFSRASFEKDAPKPAGDAVLVLTVLLPVNIGFATSPRLSSADDAAAMTLVLRRCLPGGCLADARPPVELLKDLRGASRPAHLSFNDAADRTLTLPLSTRGLAQALDNLAHEIAKDAR